MQVRKKLERLICLLAVLVFSWGHASHAQAIIRGNEAAPSYGEWPEGEEGRPQLTQAELYLMAGEPSVPLAAVSGSAISFISSNPQIAPVTAEGLITPVSPGTAYITVQIMDEQGNIYTETCFVTVMNPALASDKVTVLLNQTAYASIAVTGLPASAAPEKYGGIDCSVADVSIASASYDQSRSYVNICAKKPGKTLLTVTVRGRSLTCEIIVKGYTLNKNSLILSKGQSKTLKIKGTGEAAIFSSSDPGIAAVTKDGIVKAKGYGTTVITAVLPDFTLKCPVSVADSRAVRAVAKARSALGAVYSQKKRMQKGFYDCSSLVWRSYSPYGVTLGSRYWAPTAADEAYWCVRNKKVLYHKGIKNTKRELLPGDLIFYRKEDNGRYKNICHVAMFAGYEAENSTCGGSNEIYGIIIEADGMCVSMSDYLYNYGDGKKIVLIARPYK